MTTVAVMEQLEVFPSKLPPSLPHQPLHPRGLWTGVISLSGGRAFKETAGMKPESCWSEKSGQHPKTCAHKQMCGSQSHHHHPPPPVHTHIHTQYKVTWLGWSRDTGSYSGGWTGWEKSQEAFGNAAASLSSESGWNFTSSRMGWGGY